MADAKSWWGMVQILSPDSKGAPPYNVDLITSMVPRDGGEQQQVQPDERDRARLRRWMWRDRIAGAEHEHHGWSKARRFSTEPKTSQRGRETMTPAADASATSARPRAGVTLAAGEWPGVEWSDGRRSRSR